MRRAGSTPGLFANALRPVNTALLLGGLQPTTAPTEHLKDAVTHLPVGLVPNPLALPRCSYADLLNNRGDGREATHCPPESQVGVFKGSLNTFSFPPLYPVYNVEPTAGSPGRIAFNVAGTVVQLVGRLRQSDYGVDFVSANTSTTLLLTDARIDAWGVPAESRFDPMRGVCLESKGGGMSGSNGESCPSKSPPTSILRTPTRCGKPLDVRIEINTYEHPDTIHKANAQLPALTGCDRIPFDPSLSAQTTSRGAESATGLSVRVEMPNSGLTNPDAISESDIKKAEVTLPQGVTINPSQAEGLGVCTPAQYESTELSFHPTPGKGCPSDSKIGTVEVHTPLLEETIPGDVYVAQPDDPSTPQHGAENPFDSLLGLYIVLHEPQRGILVTIPGKVETDERTGQIVTTFDDLPQQPFSSFDFKFREGARAPLVTPPTCGTYTTKAAFTPWSDPSRQLVSNSTFAITSGPGGGPCPPTGVPPFEPGFTAGSLNNNAASYTPFMLRLTRRDGDQDMTRFSSILPPGVLGKLAGVGKCSDAAIAAAKGKTGKQELAAPSCPADAQIGRTLAGAGVGSVLAYVGGKVYLAGPYQGDPLSVVAIVPAVAGPFDVGTVVVRQALTLNPETAEVEVDGERSDPIPHILEGIPVKIRDIRVFVDRDKFILNPTSCDPSSVKATLFGGYLDVFSSADDAPVALSNRFQAVNCASLGFKPRLSLKLKGGARRGGHPALRAVLNARPGDANIGAATVTLPRSAFLDQGHIRTICTRVQFAAKACPKGAIYGHARAITPLLDEPIEGPVYLRSSNHKLPDLVAALHGLVDVNVVGRIDSFKGGIRSSFESVPDAPVSKFLLTMQGGKKGLVINSRNLCASKNRADAQFTGQNGKPHDFRPLVRPDCGGKARAKQRRR